MDGPKPLLILDDEPAYLEMLSGIMSVHLSCPVVTFSRPLAALDAMRGQKMGAVATDYFMPQMNGLEFVRLAREIDPGVSFIIITGHGPELARTDLSRLPEIRCILHKPFRWSALADEVIRHWHGVDKPSLCQF